jgi:hypothetical protein
MVLRRTVGRGKAAGHPISGYDGTATKGCDMTRYLYRGVNAELYQSTDGRLTPKACGEKFKCFVFFGGDVYFNDGSVYGESERNAVIMHQRNSSKYPTSGISTTPHYENAVRYATYGGKPGYVYKIDTTLLEANRVQAFPVDQHVSQPAIPEDQEVILVAHDFGALPNEIIIEIVNV